MCLCMLHICDLSFIAADPSVLDVILNSVSIASICSFADNWACYC
ncbi:unnamed protein product, partial [Musa textilis]